MAKLQTYKFVNPGTARSVSPAVTAARTQTLAFNRLGVSVESLGKIVKDIETVSILNTKNDQKELIAERRRKRLERDAAAEEAAELKRESSEKPKLTTGLKKAAKSGLSWIDKFLAPIGNFLAKVFTFFIGKEILEWMSDEENITKLQEFIDKASFVFKKLYDWGSTLVKTTIDGFTGLFGEDKTFGERLEGLGKLMLGIIGLKYLLNPFSLISDIVGLINLLSGRRLDEGIRDQRKLQQKGTTAASSAQTGRASSMARSTAQGNQIAVRGAQYQQQLSRVVKPGQTPLGLTQPARPSRFAGFRANLQTGTANVPLSPGLQRAAYRMPQQAQRLARSANMAAKNAMGRIPVVGALISGIYTYFEDVDPMDGEPDKNLSKALFKAGGTALGGFLGSFIPIPVLGTALGALIGEYVGELFYILINGGGISAVGAKFKKDIQQLLSVGQTFVNWAGDGFNRFLEGHPKINLFGQKVPDPIFMINPLNVLDKINLIRKAFFSRDTMDLSKYRKLGNQVTINGETKYFAGEKYGYQSLASYNQLKEEKGIQLPHPEGETMPPGGNKLIGGPVEPQPYFLGGVVKGIGNAFKGVGNAIKGAMSSPIGQVLGTAASFIPGAAPIMAGINTLATGNPMSMLGMIPGVSNFMSGPFGNIASNLFSGNFMGAATTGLGMINPSMGQMAGSLMSGGVGGLASQFGMGGIYKAMMGAMGGNYNLALKQIGAELGVNPKVLGAVENTSNRVFSDKGLSAQYAMQQAIEFIPVPMIMEKLVPIPQAVPINTGGGAVNAVPTAMQNRMR